MQEGYYASSVLGLWKTGGLVKLADRFRLIAPFKKAGRPVSARVRRIISRSKVRLPAFMRADRTPDELRELLALKSRLRRFYPYVARPEGDVLRQFFSGTRASVEDLEHAGGDYYARVARLFRRNGITAGMKLQPLGSGKQTSAYDIGNGRVLQMSYIPRGTPAPPASQHITPVLGGVYRGADNLAFRIVPKMETSAPKPSRAAVNHLKRKLRAEGLIFWDTKRANIGYDIAQRRPMVLDLGAVAGRATIERKARKHPQVWAKYLRVRKQEG